MPMFPTVLLALLLAAPPAEAAEPAPAARPTPQKASRTDDGLMISGGAIFGVSYGVPFGISVLYLSVVWPLQAAFGDRTPSAEFLWMMVPVMGPLFAAQTEYSQREPDIRALFYLDGVLQFAGAALLTTGFIMHSNERRRARLHRVHLGPGPTGLGLSLGVDF